VYRKIIIYREKKKRRVEVERPRKSKTLNFSFSWQSWVSKRKVGKRKRRETTRKCSTGNQTRNQEWSSS